MHRFHHGASVPTSFFPGPLELDSCLITPRLFSPSLLFIAAIWTSATSHGFSLKTPQISARSLISPPNVFHIARAHIDPLIRLNNKLRELWCYCNQCDRQKSIDFPNIKPSFCKVTCFEKGTFWLEPPDLACGYDCEFKVNMLMCVLERKMNELAVNIDCQTFQMFITVNWDLAQDQLSDCVRMDGWIFLLHSLMLLMHFYKCWL